MDRCKFKNTQSRTLLSYSNTFNRSKFIDKLTKRESNLLYGILSLLKNRDIITLQLRDLRFMICGNNYKQNTTSVHNTINKLIEKIDAHKITIEGEDSETLLPLFSIIRKEYKGDTTNIKSLSLKVNKEAQKLFNVLLKENFTQMDINDIRYINSKYSLTMYEHCIKFSSSGMVKIKYDDFIKELSIPQSYYKSQVKTRVINPIIKDLSKVFPNFRFKVVEEYHRGKMIPMYIIIKFDKFKIIPIDKIDSKKKKEMREYETLKIVNKELDKQIKDMIENDRKENIEEYKNIKDFIVKTLNKSNRKRKYYKITKNL